MDLRDLFDELDARATIELEEEIGNLLDASDAAIQILDEIDMIIADKLLAAALDDPR